MQFVQYKELVAILMGLPRQEAQDGSCGLQYEAMKAVFVPQGKPSTTAWNVPVNNC